jgi:hypothetical protein
MSEHISGEVVLVRMASANKDFNKKMLEELEPHVEGEGLGTVDGMVSLAEEGWTMLIDVAPAHAGLAQTLVIPRLKALLKELGVADHGTVELAPVIDEHDQWEE